MLTKLEAADIHVKTSIKMIIYDMSPVLTHVLVMAAEEMLRSIAAARNIYLDLDVTNMIRGDKVKEYRSIARASYNWFKHADRDVDANYEGPPLQQIGIVNELQTMANMHSVAKLRGGGFGYIEGVYLTFMTIAHKKLFDLDSLLDLAPGLRANHEGLRHHSASSIKPIVRQVLSEAKLS